MAYYMAHLRFGLKQKIRFSEAVVLKVILAEAVQKHLPHPLGTSTLLMFFSAMNTVPGAVSGICENCRQAFNRHCEPISPRHLLERMWSWPSRSSAKVGSTCYTTGGSLNPATARSSAQIGHSWCWSWHRLILGCLHRVYLSHSGPQSKYTVQWLLASVESGRNML